MSDLTTPPEKVELTIPQTACSDIYFAACGKIDQHNRDQQATLCLEQKFKTHDWSMRVNMSIIAICIVDTWSVWSRINDTGESCSIESRKEFFGNLSAELSIGDEVSQARTNNSQGDDNFNPEDNDPVTGFARSGKGFNPRRCTKKRRKTRPCVQC